VKNFLPKAPQKNYLKIPNSSQWVVKQWNFFFAKAKNINFFVKNFNPQILLGVGFLKSTKPACR